MEQNTYPLIPQNTKTTTQTDFVSQNDIYREQLAISLAKALENKEVREIIKQETMKQFDGDYDVLYTAIKEKQLDKGRNFDNFLFETYTNQTKSSKEQFDKSLENIPYLQFSVPVNCEKWNTEEQIPLVTYIPSNFDEKTTKYVRAFDSKGNVYLLSTQEEPNVPVVVIGSCERIAQKPIQIQNKNEKNNKATYYIKTKSFNFPNLNKIETWIQGGPEIRIGVKSNSNSVNVLKIYYFDRNQVKNGNWFYKTEELYRWDIADLETCGFGITEIDDGSNFNFEFGFTYTVSPHISFPFKLVYTGKAHDDILGQDQLYSDNLYKTLDCGDLFKMNCKY